MTKVKLLYPAGCLLIAVGSIILGRQNLGAFARAAERPVAKILRPEFLPEDGPSPQPEKSRVLKNPQLVLGGSFRVTLNATPGRLILSPASTLLALDLNDSSVKEYSESGSLIRKYSDTDGALPAQIIDFALGSDGTVWTANPNGDVVGIRPDGTKPYTLKNLHAYRLLWLKDRLLVLTVPDPHLTYGDRLFLTVSPNGQILERFGELVANQPVTGIAVLGQIAGIVPSEDRFIFAPAGPGVMASYRGDGRKQFFVQTIDPLPLPEIQVLKSGTMKLAPLPIGITRDIAVTKELVFLLSDLSINGGNTTSPKLGSMIDMYSSTNGRYLRSFTLPMHCRSFTVLNNAIYAASGNELYKWTASQGL